jgi:SOS-response transcriptional repressor LexA
MTPRQLACLKFIREYIALNEFSPTYREIAVALNLKSHGAAHMMVRRLIQQGYLRQERGGHRSLVPTDPAARKLACDTAARQAPDNDLKTIPDKREIVRALVQSIEAHGYCVTISKIQDFDLRTRSVSSKIEHRFARHLAAKRHST